jgi:hypothetical protein
LHSDPEDVSCWGEKCERDAKDAKSVCVCPYLDERRTIRRAVAGNFDRLSIGSLHGAITITGACVKAHQSTGNDSKKGKDGPVGLTPDEKPN